MWLRINLTCIALISLSTSILIGAQKHEYDPSKLNVKNNTKLRQKRLCGGQAWNSAAPAPKLKCDWVLPSLGTSLLIEIITSFPESFQGSSPSGKGCIRCRVRYLSRGSFDRDHLAGSRSGRLFICTTRKYKVLLLVRTFCLFFN